MKLIKLLARGLKGLNFTLDLAAITFLVGSNFAGKTARSDAIRLLLIGYLPELGKQPRSTFELCSGREMIVEGWFDNGAYIKRRWFLKGDVVKTEDIVTGMDLADDKIGQLAVMLHAETYFMLSDRQRVDYVFANIPNLGAENTPNSILDNVSEWLGTNEDLDSQAVKRFLQAFSKAQGEAERESEEETMKPHVWTEQTFLDFAVAFSDKEKKTARDASVVFEKTCQGLAYLRAADVAETDLGSIDKKIAALRSELEPLQTEKAQVLASAEQAKSNRSRRESIKVTLSGKADLITRRDATESQLAKLSGERDLLAISSGETIEALLVEERESDRAYGSHSDQLAEVNASIDRNERELADISSKTKCPYCGAVGDGWKALKTLEIESALHGLRTKQEQLSSHVSLLRRNCQSIDGRLARTRASLCTRNEKDFQIAAQNSALVGIDHKLELITAAESELARLPADDVNSISALESAKAAIDAKNQEIAALDQKRRSALGRAHDLERLAQAEKGRDDGKADEQAAKKAAERFREEQARVVKSAFDPLISTANTFLNGTLLSDLAYKDGEIGTWRKGAWVGHKTFSGIEKLMAYAAIQLALSSRCPVRIVLIDEMLRAQNTKKIQAFDLFVQAIKNANRSGLFDNFIGIIPGDAENYLGLADSESQVVDVDLTV